MPVLWIIDDLPEHGAVAVATAVAAGWQAQAFLSGHAALAARNANHAPQVVLIDYQLGEERGDAVARAWREAEQHKPARAPAILVGYSSSRACSQAIVAAGADTVVAKRSDDSGRNPHLAAFLRHVPMR